MSNNVQSKGKSNQVVAGQRRLRDFFDTGRISPSRPSSSNIHEPPTPASPPPRVDPSEGSHTSDPGPSRTLKPQTQPDSLLSQHIPAPMVPEALNALSDLFDDEIDQMTRIAMDGKMPSFVAVSLIREHLRPGYTFKDLLRGLKMPLYLQHRLASTARSKPGSVPKGFMTELPHGDPCPRGSTPFPATNPTHFIGMSQRSLQSALAPFWHSPLLYTIMAIVQDVHQKRLPPSGHTYHGLTTYAPARLSADHSRLTILKSFENNPQYAAVGFVWVSATFGSIAEFEAFARPLFVNDLTVLDNFAANTKHILSFSLILMCCLMVLERVNIIVDGTFLLKSDPIPKSFRKFYNRSPGGEHDVEINPKFKGLDARNPASSIPSVYSSMFTPRGIPLPLLSGCRFGYHPQNAVKYCLPADFPNLEIFLVYMDETTLSTLCSLNRGRPDTRFWFSVWDSKTSDPVTDDESFCRMITERFPLAEPSAEERDVMTKLLLEWHGSASLFVFRPENRQITPSSLRIPKSPLVPFDRKETVVLWDMIHNLWAEDLMSHSDRYLWHRNEKGIVLWFGFRYRGLIFSSFVGGLGLGISDPLFADRLDESIAIRKFHAIVEGGKAPVNLQVEQPLLDGTASIDVDILTVSAPVAQTIRYIYISDSD